MIHHPRIALLLPGELAATPGVDEPGAQKLAVYKTKREGGDADKRIPLPLKSIQ